MPTTGLTLASANRVQLRAIEEASFGVIPVAGNPKNIRMTGESLDFGLTKENDKEINSTAMLTSCTTVGAQANGDVKVHMQYGEYDPFLASVMRTTWSAYGTNGVGTSFTADFTATTITASVAPTGSSAFTTLKKGQWFFLTTGGANNNKLLRVSTTTAPTSTVITLDTNTPAAVASSVATCVVKTSRLMNGVTLTAFTLEKEAADIVQFLTYRGMYVSKFSVGFNSAALTDGTFSFLGKDQLINAVTQLPGTPTASLSYDIQNAVTGVGNVWEAGAPMVGVEFKSLTLEIDSGLRPQDAIGTLGLVGVGIGTFTAKGTISAYFANDDLYQKFLTDEYTSISMYTKDSANNGYVFTMPKVMLKTAKVQAGGKDTDLMVDFEYEAYQDAGNADSTLRVAMIIDRFGAAVAP